MPQYILLGSYVGLSGYVYEVSCSGRPLNITEAIEQGLTNEKELGRNSTLSYSNEWFEVSPSDTIEVRLLGADYGEGNHHYRFTVQEAGLTKAPQTLPEHLGNQLHHYLQQQCICAHEELPMPSDD